MTLQKLIQMILLPFCVILLRADAFFIFLILPLPLSTVFHLHCACVTYMFAFVQHLTVFVGFKPETLPEFTEMTHKHTHNHM